MSIYDEETKNLRYHIADYYLFSKLTYQLPLVWRTFLWQAFAVYAALACGTIPFAIYGKGVGDGSGKTVDLFSVAFATYQAIVMVHHMQMFVTIRNYTKFFAFTCTLSILILWPCTMLLSHFELVESEELAGELGNIMFDQWFY